MFLLKIQRDFCHPKSFGTFEKRAPSPDINLFPIKGKKLESTSTLHFSELMGTSNILVGGVLVEVHPLMD